MVAMSRALVLAALIAGCHAGIGLPAGEHADASAGGDGTPGPDGAAAIDAPTCFNGRVVFLEFGGVTLTQGATDASTNHAAWIGVATATVPAYHLGVANRMGQIQNITDAFRASLSRFPITVVTTRPAAGPYVMVVFGGQKTDVGTIYSYATADHDCGDALKNDVAWLSDVAPTAKAADYAVGAVAWALGLDGTNDPADCMCSWGNGCVQTAAACTLATSIATTPNLACGTANPQKEVAVFTQAFCQ
jgi:hypothetical protein